MFRQRTSAAEAMPRGWRVAVNVLIILGVFAMHNLTLGAGDAAEPHHATSSMTQTVGEVTHAGKTVVVETLTSPGAEGMQGLMSDCDGLMALCMALVLGVGAYVVLRKRLADRVLWQLPPPTRARSVAMVPPFNSRSPLERSSILRC